MTSARFGEVYEVKVADWTELRLIVSGDFYNVMEPHNVITVDVASRDRALPVIATVDLGELGLARMDRVRSVDESRLGPKVGEIQHTRHDEVRQVWRALCD